MKNRFRLLSALLIAVMALSLSSAVFAAPGDAGGIRVYIPNKLERLHVPDMPEYIALYTRTESVATYGNPKDLNNPGNLKDPCPILAVSEPELAKKLDDARAAGSEKVRTADEAIAKQFNV